MTIENRLSILKKASKAIRVASAEKKNLVLSHLCDLISKKQKIILKANILDIKQLQPGASEAFQDRLLLSKSRLDQVAESVRQITKLPDPVGEVVEKRRLENKLLVIRERAPLGVLFMIFESRPNVAVEAFSLAIKSGNSLILRGGRESRNTVTVFYEIFAEALKRAGFQAESFWGIVDPNRRIVTNLLKQKTFIDVVVPRGGESLISFVEKHSRIPIIKNDRGLCHVYIHEDAQIKMALQIVENAKVQRPGVCNSMETLLVHKKIAPKILPHLYSSLQAYGVQWVACARTLEILKNKKNITSTKRNSFSTEYLALTMNCRVVESKEEALAHIERYGSKHSECIITSSSKVAHEFQKEVDAAAVYWNASTRFTDGFALGLGGELGISTQKLHVRGPVGLRELTSTRWVIQGNGQVRI